MKQNNKICAFCGMNADNKTKEHVIPKWLLTLTGGNRQIEAGYDRKNGEIKNMASFQFTIPACYKCNNKFSLLESKTKIIIEKILNHTPLIAKEIPDLLDWLEKMRITTWYSDYYFNKNFPKMKSRKESVLNTMGKNDRMVSIYYLPQIEGLSFWGAGSIGYYVSPAVLGLRFKNILFVYHYGQFTLSKHFKLPYPCENSFFNYDHGLMMIYKFKLEYLNTIPDVCSISLPANIVFFQPIMTNTQRTYYEHTFQKEHPIFKGYSSKESPIFILKKNKLQYISSQELQSKKISWSREQRWSGKNLLKNYFDICNFYIDKKIHSIGYENDFETFKIMKYNYEFAFKDNLELRKIVIQ